MVVATEYPTPEKVGRGQKASAAEAFPMVVPRRLQEARTVIAYAADLCHA
jgi:hypothetical protein